MHKQKWLVELDTTLLDTTSLHNCTWVHTYPAGCQLSKGEQAGGTHDSMLG